MPLNMPSGSGITGTTRIQTGVDGSAMAPAADIAIPTSSNVVGYGSSPSTGTTMLSPAIQTIWSKEILFQSMPVLRFEQFAVKKTELGVMPGLTVNFMRYNNLPIPDGPLVEGVRMKTHGISAQQYRITVAEQGFAVAVSELLLNASFDDIMASASRLLGRNMALYMDGQARGMLQSASSVVYGRTAAASLTTGYGIYNAGPPGTNAAGTRGVFHTYTVKDAVLELASKNIPRLGEVYVCFIHPAQSRMIRDVPEFIEVTKYAAPGNFMLGEIGRLYDVVFIETTQISSVPATAPGVLQAYKDRSNLNWRGDPDGTLFDTTGATPRSDLGVGATALGGKQVIGAPGDYNTASGGPDLEGNAAGTAGPSPQEPGAVSVPGWDQKWPADYAAFLPSTPATDLGLEAIMLGDNAFGHAVSLPVELRDGGVLDFGREHALAWYSIWGFGLITDSAVVKIRTDMDLVP
jgi:N4-gp56 family major capsid protein